MELETIVLVLFVFALASLFIGLSLTKNSRKKYMAKKPTISLISTGYSSTEQLNENFTALRDAFDNTLSLDGSTPNAMSAAFDLNSNDILNGGTINATDFVLDGQSISALATSAAEAETSATNAATSETNAASSAAAAQAVEDQLPDWQGPWVTSTAYETGDLVRESGTAYICIEAHTSGTFSTDLTNNKWEVFAEKGAAGDGTGDMLAANNLSDVADAATARSNISAQESSLFLTQYATRATSGDTLPYLLQGTQGDPNQIVYVNFPEQGRDLVAETTSSGQRTVLGLGTASTRNAEDTLTDGANLPDGAAVKSYVDSRFSRYVSSSGNAIVAN